MQNIDTSADWFGLGQMHHPVLQFYTQCNPLFYSVCL